MSKLVAKYKIDGVDSGTLGECFEYISALKVVGLDIETKRKYRKGTYPEDVYKGGLDPFLTVPVMLQIGDLEEQFVIDLRDFSKEQLQPILNFLDYNPDIIIVGQNLKFEQKHLKHNYGINFHTVFDTMLGELCLYNGIVKDISLAGLAERYLGVQKKREVTLFGETLKWKTITLDEDLLKENENAITPFEVEDGFQLDKSTRLQFINIGDRPFTKEQVLYGKDDIIFPILIRQRQLVGRILEDGTIHRPFNWWKVENHYCLGLADIELNGMPIVPKMWEELHDKNYIIYQERKKKLDTWILKHYPGISEGTPDLFSGEKKCHIEWTSPKQVVHLYKQWNRCPRAYSKQTKQVEDTVGATELLRTLPNSLKVKYQKDKDVEITDLDTFTLAYLLFKKSQQAVTTFGKSWLKYVHPITGRCHTSYRQILNTTRISSNNPNMNNISGGDWRACFRVGEDEVMVNLDYSSQEVRRLADVCQDETLMNFFVKGDEYFQEDFHSFTATKVYKILENNPELVVPPKEIRDDKGELIKHPEFTEDDGERRANSKEVTFGMAFGKSVYTFSLDLGLDIKETEKFVNSYLLAFPGLKTHFERCENRAEKHDYIMIEKITGAAWFCPFFKEIEDAYEEAWSHFPDGYSKLSKEEKAAVKRGLYEEKPFVRALFQKAGRLRSSLVNKNKNYPIQGSCSQMMKIAMNIARKRFIEEKVDARLVANIYDEVLCVTKKELGETVGKILKEAMEKAGKMISPGVPQLANFVLRPDWAH